MTGAPGLDGGFRTRILVRFGDLDPAGIAYYPRLVNFLHEAFEDFFAGHVGRPYPAVFRDGLGFPTVKVDMEFLAPVHYGDEVEVRVVVEKIGRSSVQIRYEGSVGGRPVFRARNVAVVVDLKTFRPTPLPTDLRERFEAAGEESSTLTGHDPDARPAPTNPERRGGSR